MHIIDPLIISQYCDSEPSQNTQIAWSQLNKRTELVKLSGKNQTKDWLMIWWLMKDEILYLSCLVFVLRIQFQKSKG